MTARVATNPAVGPRELASLPRTRFRNRLQVGLTPGHLSDERPRQATPSLAQFRAVNLAWAGPRGGRSACTSRTLLGHYQRAGAPGSGDVGAGPVRRVPRPGCGATSTATLPTPMTATASRVQLANRPGPRRGGRAVPVDEVGGRIAAGQVLPRCRAAGHASRRSRRRRRRSCKQVLAGHVVTEVHAAEELHLGRFEDLAQDAGDRLDEGCESRGDPVPGPGRTAWAGGRSRPRARPPPAPAWLPV